MAIRRWSARTSFSAAGEPSRTAGETHVEARYVFRGAALDREKIEKAVNLSLTRYCGVHAKLAESDGLCRAFRVDGTPCPNKSKDGIYCGVHAKLEAQGS